KAREAKEATAAKPEPLAIDYALDTLWRDIANYLMAGLAGLNNDSAVGKKADAAARRLRRDLDVMIKMMRDPKQFLSIELEALVRQLLTTRLEFGRATTDARRQELGKKIGQLSRQAILLNDFIQQTPSSTALTASPLEDKIMAEINNINWVRYHAQTEKATRDRLNDNIGLLGRNTVTVANPLADAPGKDTNAVAPGSFKTDILNDEAFPELTDRAANKFMSELNDRIREEQRQVDKLREVVLPKHPTYELDEFYAMYQRYYAFISHQKELQDNQYKTIAELMGLGTKPQAVYQLLGLDPGSEIGKLEGAVSRAFLLMFVAQQLQQSQAGPTAEFTSVLNANPVKQTAKPATGTAGNPDFQFGSFFQDPGSFNANAAAAETADRENFQRDQQRISSKKFNAVEKEAPPARPDEAANQGLVKSTDKKRPIMGMKNTQAQDGWNFLVDVYDITGSQVLVREQKTMPPEVVAYLEAQQQLHETLANKHRPQANGKPIGDAGIIANGVEGGTGSARSRLIDGKAVPEDSAQAKELRETIKNASDNGKKKTSANNQAIVVDLIQKLQEYFHGFYKARNEPYRLASVLIIGNIEHNLFAEIKNTFDAHRMAKVAGFGALVTTGIGVAKAIGNKIAHTLGDAVAKGIGQYLGTQNVTSEAAIAGILTFLANAAYVSNINEARAWGLLSKVVAGDATAAFDNAINHAVSAGLTKTSELVKDAYDNRAGKIPVGKDVKDPTHSDETPTEKERIKDEQKEAQKKDPAKKDPVSKEPDFSTLGPKAQQAAMEAALPPDLQGKVTIFKTNKGGKGVHVQFIESSGELVMSWDASAVPRNITEHVPVARELARYQGLY
ncbi:MAG TPA: hypothetical protein VI233_17740, partial [Puia sp.]